jgi:hypothetical protein
MSFFSLIFKGQLNGTSPTEQDFPCQSINSKNPQRERERESIARSLSGVIHFCKSFLL